MHLVVLVSTGAYALALALRKQKPREVRSGFKMVRSRWRSCDLTPVLSSSKVRPSVPQFDPTDHKREAEILMESFLVTSKVLMAQSSIANLTNGRPKIWIMEAKEWKGSSEYLYVVMSTQRTPMATIIMGSLEPLLPWVAVPNSQGLLRNCEEPWWPSEVREGSDWLGIWDSTLKQWGHFFTRLASPECWQDLEDLKVHLPTPTATGSTGCYGLCGQVFWPCLPSIDIHSSLFLGQGVA